MKTVQFTTAMNRFETKGEKTGWTYIEIPADLAQQLKPGNKREFKVKGKLDSYAIKRVSLMPMGDGSFIMPINASMRKGLGKKHGAMVKVSIAIDNSEFIFNKDFMECIADEPAAETFFKTLTGSHQRYFSKWIDDAKTVETKTKRIAMAVSALAKKWGYPEMIRAGQKKNKE
ncbi:MAG TPA: YdeI/OmpD-associated family protein [Chitinophagaceae bacterium]